LLSEARDPNITLQLPGGDTVGTFGRDIRPKFNFAQIKALVPNLKIHGRNLATGRFDDGIGYVLIGTWGGAAADFEPAFAALAEFADAPGIVLDVRANAGGNERIAREIAGCFLQKPVVYSKSLLRDPKAAGGFSSPHDRVANPNEKRKHVGAKAAVLMGPANMSSCESFLLMMREAPAVTLIGERSYGSSGNPKPHELAKDFFVLLPSWKDLLPDGTLLEGRGVEPDIRVETGDGAIAADDPVLERGLRHLRGRGD
jgi:C-terminal processing protease CtpA/Prc